MSHQKVFEFAINVFQYDRRAAGLVVLDRRRGRDDVFGDNGPTLCKCGGYWGGAADPPEDLHCVGSGGMESRTSHVVRCRESEALVS